MNDNVSRIRISAIIIPLTAMMFLFAWQDAALAGCRINVFAENTGNNNIDIDNTRLSINVTAVKSKGGTWRGLRKGGWFTGHHRVSLNAKQKKGDQYNAAFGCNKKRRYRFLYQCKNGKHSESIFTQYYPSATRWTKRQTFTAYLSQCK